MENKGFPLARIRFQSRFLFLLVSILLLIVLTPFLENFFRLKIIMNIFFTVILVSGIHAVSGRKRSSFIASLMALPMLVAIWSRHTAAHPSVVVIGHAFGILFFGFAILHILSFVFRKTEVSAEVLHAAIVVYLLLAVMWTFIYGVIELCREGSFSIARQDQMADNRMLLIYYSFVTITTLGYGDITPMTAIARSFTLLEAVVGQIYLVVIVAWLVGMHVSQTPKRKA